MLTSYKFRTYGYDFVVLLEIMAVGSEEADA